MRTILDTLRAISAPRLDSINNGADDDASGSMTVLEIAEQFAKGAEKPKRSILFVWHTGEEAGLLGVTPLAGAPRVEVLGIYPTLEGLGAQAAALLVLLLGFAWNRRASRRLAVA